MIPRIRGVTFGDTGMNGLDEMLEELRAAPLPSRLMAIDDAVLLQLAERRAGATPLSSGMVGLAVVVALGMGVAGAVIPGTRAEAAPSLSPFGAPVHLMPSTLLDSAE
jgi:hypothetical protein